MTDNNDMVETAIGITDEIIKSVTMGSETMYDEKVANATRITGKPLNIGVVGNPHESSSLRFLPSVNTFRCFEAVPMAGKDLIEPSCPLCGIGVPTRVRRCYDISDSSYTIFDLAEFAEFVTRGGDTQKSNEYQPVLRKDTDYTKLPKYKLVDYMSTSDSKKEYCFTICSSEKSYVLVRESDCNKNRADRRSPKKKHRVKNDKEEKVEDFWDIFRSAEPLCYDTETQQEINLNGVPLSRIGILEDFHLGDIGLEGERAYFRIKQALEGQDKLLHDFQVHAIAQALGVK